MLSLLTEPEAWRVASPPPGVPADLALAAAAGAGDPEASERFVRRALPLVRRVARALIADRTESEDALQLALIEVLGAAPTFRGTGPLDHWIRKVASRAVLGLATRCPSANRALDRIAAQPKGRLHSPRRIHRSAPTMKNTSPKPSC